MTYFDYVIITIMLASMLLGVWRGVVGEIIALTAWILAFLAARWFGAEVAQAFFTGIVDPVLRLVAAWVTIFVVVLILMALLRLAVRGLLSDATNSSTVLDGTNLPSLPCSAMSFSVRS